MISFFSSKFKNDNSSKALLPENENNALRFIYKLTIIGIVAIFLYSLRYSYKEQLGSTITSFLSTFSIGLLIAGATFAIGAFVGFLFGIPRNFNEPDKTRKDNHYSDNDNLVQVSDWLSKIIVGVGLTQLMVIPGFLYKLGEFFKPALGDDDVAVVIAISIIIYFLICGFLMCYLWTRIYFKQMLGQADNDYEKLKTNLKQLNDYFATGGQPTDNRKTQPEKFLNLNIPDAEDKKMPPEDDPQKYQWGEKSVDNGRELKAVITPSMVSKDYFNVELSVISTQKNKPLSGTVDFHLHPSFRNSDPIIEVENGVAKLNLLAWGAFTVGAEADNGSTRLELDLSELRDAPALFKSR